MEKMVSHPDYSSLLEKLGAEDILSEEVIQNCIEFVKVVVYGGKRNETLVDTKVRMYLAQKKKTK